MLRMTTTLTARPHARLSRSTVEGTGPRHQGRPDRGADGRSERAARAIDQGARCIAHGHGHAHARDEGNGGHLKAINGKLIAAETSLEKLRDKEIGSSQLVWQKAFMSNFLAAKRCVQACTTEASTSTMEAATSAAAVGYTVEQVRAQQNDRIFRRAVQNLHVHRGNGRARTHARTGDEAREALEKLPAKDINRAQCERRRPSCSSSYPPKR